MNKSFSLCLLVAILSLSSARSSGQETSRSDEDLFEIHVRPTLIAHCIRCHGETKQESGLQLTSLEAILRGGDSGAAIVPGKPDESLLLEAVRYESFEMPPDQRLDQQIVAGLTKWIAAGAPWPDGTVLRPTPKIAEEDRQWWCYQPITDPQPPSDVDSLWCRGDIDRFIDARLSDNGIDPAKEADPLTLVRRVHFAITGLPPDESVIDEALASDFDYDALVDRLLESKSYGENQAKHWLDLVRYAETDGYRADHARPEAYRYRDYVIQSFNDDKPYDRFIREQIAGDEIDPGNRESLVATMYLRHWIYEHNQRDVETQWHEILSDITETTGDVFLAQGLKCARCHDHKFDPILQKDYYRIKAFFAAFQPSENHPIADVEARRTYQEKLRAWEEATADVRKRLHEIENPVLLKHATREGFDKFIPEIKAMIRARAEQRSPYEHQIASLASRQFDLPHDKIEEWLSEEEKEERQELRKQLASFDSIKPQPLPAMKFVASDVGPVAPATYIPDDETKTTIAPGFLSLLDPSDAEIVEMPEPLRTTGRRTTLANWIANENNPLTARVIVNRIWQQHFGRGLVETSSDFGHLGSPPSHPKLLDWLASRFIEDGWSLKKLHRRILTSATFRQTSLRPTDDTLARIDPTCNLLWRMNPRRLSGEEIHDAILSASGELIAIKRAIFKPVKRNTPDPVLAAFDGPDRIRSIGKRHQTTTSTQALLMSNSDWTHDRAAILVRRYARGEGDINENLIDRLYRTLYGRSPSQEELYLAKEFLKQYAEATPDETPPKTNSLAQMPVTGGSAIDLKPGGVVGLNVPSSESLPNGDFTVEAVVLLRSLYKDASVRTIVSHWDGNKKHSGWSLGVTSTRSAYKPRNLILQLIGKTKEDDKLHYEVIPSNLRPELNKPYYLAATVKLDDTSESGVTFYMKDLSQKDGKLQTASANHTVIGGIRPDNDLAIGGRKGRHLWDGLIDNVRVEAAQRDLAMPAQAESAAGLPQYAFDFQFDLQDDLGHDGSGQSNHANVSIAKPVVKSPIERARVAWVHALLNSNELIYVD